MSSNELTSQPSVNTDLSSGKNINNNNNNWRTAESSEQIKARSISSVGLDTSQVRLE